MALADMHKHDQPAGMHLMLSGSACLPAELLNGKTPVLYTCLFACKEQLCSTYACMIVALQGGTGGRPVCAGVLALHSLLERTDCHARGVQ